MRLIERVTATDRLRTGVTFAALLIGKKSPRRFLPMLALSFVDAAEIPSSTGWSPLALQPVVRAQPAECLEEGAD
jgi:hypothetical protein